MSASRVALLVFVAVVVGAGFLKCGCLLQSRDTGTLGAMSGQLRFTCRGVEACGRNFEAER
eukprot:8996187-Alexandrium_andersonii.AAC.1